MAELGELGDVQAELERRGGTILAVSVDPPAESNRMVKGRKFRFPVLADVDRTVIREYGVLHAQGGPGKSDIALPAQFLVERDGRIVWRHVAEKIQDRPDPEDVLAEVRRL